MKPRARRISLVAAALGMGLTAVLVLANWGTVRDHVQAWHFQLTRETISTGPCPFIFIFDSEDAPEDWRNFYNDLSAGLSAGPADRWRFLEQRFPRRAYVVIRDSTSPGQIPEEPQRFMGASTTIDLKAAPGTPRSPFSEQR
jgi:hypothetical protein